MSPNGTQPAPVAGSQAVLKPCEARLARTCWARPTQYAPGAPSDRYAPVMDGFRPDGRKKFNNAESTQTGWPGALQPLIANGLLKDWPSASVAVKKLLSIKSPRTALELIGRLRCFPAL